MNETLDDKDFALIDELKKKEEDAFKQFIEYKKKFNEVSDKLKEKLAPIGKMKEEIDKVNETVKDKRESTKRELLNSKGREVEEKLKKGMKLTTEDLLVFQNMDDNRN